MMKVVDAIRSWKLDQWIPLTTKFARWIRFSFWWPHQKSVYGIHKSHGKFDGDIITLYIMVPARWVVILFRFGYFVILLFCIWYFVAFFFELCFSYLYFKQKMISEALKKYYICNQISSRHEKLDYIPWN